MLGGNLLASAIPPGKEKLQGYHRFLLQRLERSPVRVRLNTTADVPAILHARPGVVVVASGAQS
ncbi:hypothetical protein, partial [Shinella sp.]|uniref:hypothetical protein n=1 Tax=Shinella sp. TaxID=1870904 RepID=UPI0039E58717